MGCCKVKRQQCVLEGQQVFCPTRFLIWGYVLLKKKKKKADPNAAMTKVCTWGISSNEDDFFFFLCACVCGDRKWVGANDKWKRSAPFISPASGVKWGTGCNHSRCFRGVVLVLQCFFLQSASRRGATTFVWKRFSGIIQKHHLFQSYHLDPQPNKQILRQRAFLFLIVSAPPSLSR